MAEEAESIVAEMEALIVPPHGKDAEPVPRTAHFLKPICNGRGRRPALSPSSFPLPPELDHSRCRVKVVFHSWRNPPREWWRWAAEMELKHGDAWRKAGILEAVRASTRLTLRKDPALLLSLARRWSPETNTFVFRWGEATVTLEDVMVGGGYSVLGPDVVLGLETEEMERAERKLQRSWLRINKRNQYQVRAGQWIERFMGSGSEVEHEAFLALWLSRFVLPQSVSVMKNTFPAAIHLARGNRVALAPAVLVAIYRDLSRLKREIDWLAGGTGNVASKLDLWAVFQLVQVWIWERFPTVRPNPSPARYGEPRITKWTRKSLKLPNVEKAIDAAAEIFQWRPYARSSENPDLYKFYPEDEMWVSIDGNSDDELLSFTRILIPCQLVGLGDCVEQYLPHRVGMQFGMDQDLPCALAWSPAIPNLSRAAIDKPVTGMKLYIPSRVTEAGVTTRYSKWWAEPKANSGALVEAKNVRRRKRKALVNDNMQKKKKRIDLSVPCRWGRKGMRSKRKTKKVLNLLWDLFDFSKSNSSGVLTSSAGSSTKEIDVSVHPGLQQNELDDSSDEDHLTVQQFLSRRKRGGMGNPTAAGCVEPSTDHVGSPTLGGLPLISEKSLVEDVKSIVKEETNMEGWRSTGGSEGIPIGSGVSLPPIREKLLVEDVKSAVKEETNMEGWRSTEGSAGIPIGRGVSIAENAGKKVSEMTVKDLRDILMELLA